MEHLQSFIADCDRRTDLAKRRLKETQEELSEEATAKVRRGRCHAGGGDGCSFRETQKTEISRVLCSLLKLVKRTTLACSQTERGKDGKLGEMRDTFMGSLFSNNNPRNLQFPSGDFSASEEQKFGQKRVCQWA